MSEFTLSHLSGHADLPEHIAVIMDGNGRWAKSQGEDRIFGHQNGVHSVRQVVEGCAEAGIKYLTLYAFSTENWNRPAAEVSALMELLVHTISAEIPTLQKNNVSLKTIGNIKQLPENCYNELHSAMTETAHNDGLSLVLALSYSARWDILNAVQVMVNENSPADINEKLTDTWFKSYLSTSQIPDPALLIRTSGEQRISNFLLWECAYTEFYFTPKMWPEFDKKELEIAINTYMNRERRFGLTSEQIKI
ncbi:MAG: isoprenyl transferase [Bacteroidota bacterium]|nr:isoprenyl transferase [Bacteroidota bacterium]